MHLSLDEIVKTYSKRVFGYLFKMKISKEDCEDILQEIFIRVQKNLDKFDLDKNIEPWLFTIARNEKNRFLNKQNKSFSFDLSKAFTQETPESIVIEKTTSEIVSDEISKLSPSQREILLLKFNSNLTFKEISKLLDIKESTVKYRLYDCFIILKRRLRHAI